MLLVNLPSMLTKGLFSTLLSYPAKELSYFFTLQSVILPAFVTLPTTSCQMALYSCSTFHTPQLLQTPPCIISSSPFIANWSFLLSMTFFYSLLGNQTFPNSAGFALGWRYIVVHLSERLIPTQQTIVLKMYCGMLTVLILPCKVSQNSREINLLTEKL
jgi:hypothetical protein